MHSLKPSQKANCTSLSRSAQRAPACPRLFQAPLDATRVIAGPSFDRAVRPASRPQRWQNPPVVICQAGRGSGDPWWLKDNPANMKDINSIQELVDELADAGDRLVIVEFYAHALGEISNRQQLQSLAEGLRKTAGWCNACRALFPKICKMVGENPDVLFLKVNFDDNRDACRTLGVKVLPFFHLYRGAEGRVASFSCTISKLQVFKDALENFSSPFCSLEPTPGLREFPAIIAHPELHPEEAAAAAAAALSSIEDEAELHPLANTPTVVG